MPTSFYLHQIWLFYVSPFWSGYPCVLFCCIGQLFCRHFFIPISVPYSFWSYYEALSLQPDLSLCKYNTSAFHGQLIYQSCRISHTISYWRITYEHISLFCQGVQTENFWNKELFLHWQIHFQENVRQEFELDTIW